MLRLHLTVIFFLAWFCAGAQVSQIGIVRELNSHGRPIAGVGIELPSATDLQPTFSDQNGLFKLFFSKKKAGEIIYNLSIVKQDYEIVNIYELNDGWTLTPFDTLEIVIAKKGVIAEMRNQYYNLITQYQDQQYKNKIRTLKIELEKNQITASEYSKKIELLEKELRFVNSRLTEYADKFARINRDKMDSISACAFKMIEKGDIAGAIIIYENNKLLLQLKQKITQREESQQSINFLVPKLREEIHCRLMASGEENLAQIDTIYREIIHADSSNFRFLMDYTQFLTDLQHFQEALKWNKKSIPLARNRMETIEALENLGHIEFKLQDFESAETYLQAAVAEADKLKEENPEQYLKAISLPLNSLATLYLEKDQLLKAEEYYLKTLEVRAQICQTDSSFLADYAIALNNIGILYEKMYQINSDSSTSLKSMHYLKEAVIIRKNLANVFPTQYSYALANTYNNLASIFIDIGERDSALTYYLKAKTILEEILPQNPNMYSEYYVINLFNIGYLHSKMNNYEQAQYYYDSATDICDKYLIVNPELYQFHKSNLLNNKGVLLKKLKKFDDARVNYQEALTLRRLIQSSDNQYDYYIFESLYNLGSLEYSCKKFDSAVIYLKEAKEILQILSQNNPTIYEARYANLTTMIAYIYYLQKNKKNGKTYYKEAFSLYKKLDKMNPGKYDKVMREIKQESKALKHF